MTASPHRIYTNDLERERLRQAAYATTPTRLSLNRHRTRRSAPRNLTIVAIVARERGDMTIYNECREALNLPAGSFLVETYEEVASRRQSRAQRRGFASNRMLDIQVQVLDQAPAPSFPMSDDPALAAAKGTRLVAHA